MTIPNTFNRHYPFAQRDFTFGFPWDVTKLPITLFTLDKETPKGNGIDLFGNDITKIIDEPDLLPPFPAAHGGNGKTHDYTPTSTTPTGLPAGWTVQSGSARIEVFFIIRTNAPSGVDFTRRERRVYKLDFGMSTRVSVAVTVTNPSPFGQYSIGFTGYWRNSASSSPGLLPPTDPFWEEADTPPTLHRLAQRGHRDYYRQFVPADWVQETKTATPSGTVPADVSDFMDDWLDDIDDDISTATIDATWRLAAIGWAFPISIGGNYNFIVDSFGGVRF
jgi:hypothetical protein